MAERLGKYTIVLNSHPSVTGFAAVVGKTEGEGPLKDEFDFVLRMIRSARLRLKSGERTPKRGRDARIIKSRENARRSGFLSCRRPFEPMHRLVVRSAIAQYAFYRALRSVLHHGSVSRSCLDAC